MAHDEFNWHRHADAGERVHARVLAGELNGQIWMSKPTPASNVR